jgi:pimeloyl-ACP methyl ester carboxylesterase
VSLMHLIETDTFIWEVAIYGEGTYHWMAFAGFGETHICYEQLAKHLPDNHRLLVINHPAHGNSIIKNKADSFQLSKGEYQREMEAILSHFSIQEFGLMGYSLGGRLAMTLANQFPERVKKILLFAPDGLRKTPFHFLGKLPKITSPIFNFIRKKPGSIIATGKFLNASGIIPDMVFKFSTMQLQTQEKRNQLYMTWFVLNNIFPNLKKLRKNVQTHGIQMDVFMGTKDPIIPLKHLKVFKHWSPNEVVIHKIPTRHRILDHLEFNQFFPAQKLQLQA